MKKTYEITIEGTPKTWNAFINKTHWAYYAYKQTITKQIKFATYGRNLPTMPMVRVSYYLGYPTKRRSDIDSLCLKPHLDALVAVGVVKDDSRFIVREVKTTWEKSEKPFTKIVIEEL